MKRIALILCLVLASIGLEAFAQSTEALADPPQAAPADFKGLVAKLVMQVGTDAAGLEADEEQALGMLDRATLAMLNGQTPDVNELNRRLAQWITRDPPLGESYRAFRLPGNPAAYALTVNFGVAGPSAIRIYAGPAGKMALVAVVDRFSQPAYEDNFVEVVPWNGTEPSGLFLTISGRTDQLNTGVFAAWRFDGRGVSGLWISDILEESTYELGPDGFRITYCGEPDVNDSTKCLHRELDRYGWSNGYWRLLESTDLPAAKTN